MTLTVTTAMQAGQVAVAINNVTQLIDLAQAALATGAPVYQLSMNLQGQPNTFFSNLILSEDDTKTIINAFLAILQNNLTALNAQLASF